MINKRAKIRVIFNDAHANIPSNSSIPQGGVSSFAHKFSNYFDNKSINIELVSLLFSHNPKNKDIYTKETIGNHKYYELYYPREKLIESYQKKYTKKEYNEFLKPWLNQVDKIFETVKPDIVFLNGFSLSNWLIMEVANKRKIPICTQHAGIWKKELSVSQKNFSTSIKRIFSSYEREIYKKASHLIFLNNFSRDVFFSIHNIKKENKALLKTSIIPLPINTGNINKINLEDKKHYNIGIVARWDRVKNHDAILRFAKFVNKNNLPFSINVVTGWGLNNTTNFKNEYKKFIKIIKPMPPEKLSAFYKSQDIIMIPSRFDVSPTVLMEAILCGKPIIISNNVGWISDYYNYKLDKLIIDYRASGKSIYNTINELIKNKATYLKKFEKMQQKIIIKNNEKEIFKSYNNIFNKLSKN